MPETKIRMEDGAGNSDAARSWAFFSYVAALAWGSAALPGRQNKPRTLMPRHTLGLASYLTPCSSDTKALEMEPWKRELSGSG